MDIFTALSEPTRRKILELLASQGDMAASELYRHFPVSPPAISQHLKVLREAGLVQMEKRAQQHIYRLNAGAMLELEDWARRLRQLWNERFDALDQLLAREQERMNAMLDMNHLNSVKEVTIQRTFNAPRDLVFKAWTDPALMAQWWGPHGFTNPVCEVDLRPGGKLFIQMQAPDGTLIPNHGIFNEVVPPERLVLSSTAFEDGQGRPQLEVRTTVTFEAQGSQTALTLHAVVVRAEPAVNEALAGMEEGWRESFERLAGLLAKA